jgi:uncharacterized membrane protein YphA (DoxX/SURF4 family)
MKHKTILLLRVILGGIFLYAGIVKAGDGQAFTIALMPFTIIPSGWTGILAYSLAWTEIVAGILILSPRIYPIGVAMIVGLSLVFISVITWALASGIIVSCGCFGGDEAPSAGKMIFAILRDGFILSSALAILFLPSFSNRESPALAKSEMGD